MHRDFKLISNNHAETIRVISQLQVIYLDREFISLRIFMREIFGEEIACSN